MGPFLFMCFIIILVKYYHKGHKMKLVEKDSEKYINTSKVHKVTAFYGIDVYTNETESELFFVCLSTLIVLQVVTITPFLGGGGTLNILKPDRYLEEQ